MMLRLDSHLLQKIHRHGEQHYPEEGAGLLLGLVAETTRQVLDILPLDNRREESARHNRYLIAPEDVLQAEIEAQRRGLEIVGVFHSHPDHPNRPSEFDQDWALPWYSYLITSIQFGRAAESRSWRLAEDRSQFFEEALQIGPEYPDQPGESL